MRWGGWVAGWWGCRGGVRVGGSVDGMAIRQMLVMIFSYTLVYPLLVNVPGHSLHGVVVAVFIYNFTALLSVTQGVLSLLTSVTFEPPRPSELR